MSLSAPYRFVPLSKLVLLPDWADQVSHDHPFKDGVCGELSINLRCDTPLCVGGEQDPSSKNAPGRVHFFRTPDNQLAIPGSSLKGMLRNVLEIASFARFKQVEDQWLGVRDISDGKNFYSTSIVRTPVEAGWLNFKNGDWYVQPCEFSRLHQKDLIDWCKVKKYEWTNKSKALERYKLIGLCPEIRFDMKAMKNGKKLQAIPNKAGKNEGRIIVTGQPGSAFDTSKTAKKYEFVFHTSAKNSTRISDDVIRGFRQIHSESDEWAYWQKELSSGGLSSGIPVFFHSTATGSIKSMGLAMMYKLPYENSLHDAIRHTLTDHLDSEHPDLSDLIFGFLGNDSNEGLRGRVNIGMATTQGDDLQTSWEGPVILNGPKPTFYPTYIRQDGKQTQQLMEKNSELSGWKRYPTKALDIQYPTGKAAENLKTQVKLETVPDGTEFNFKVRIHNLRRVELGALLWSLDFGEKPECRHGLGMGRPFGFGQVALSITASKLRANDSSFICHQRPDTYFKICRDEFDLLMEQYLTKADSSWSNCPPIKELQNLAQPVSNRHHLESLRYLPKAKNFVSFRKSENLQEVIETFHTVQPVIPPADYDHSQRLSFQSDFETSLKLIEKAEAKANATEEDRILMTIEDLTNNYHSDTCTKTTKDNLASEFNNAHKQQNLLSDEQQIRVRNMADTIDEQPNNKLGKAIKKIKRDFP